MSTLPTFLSFDGLACTILSASAAFALWAAAGSYPARKRCRLKLLLYAMLISGVIGICAIRSAMNRIDALTVAEGYESIALAQAAYSGMERGLWALLAVMIGTITCSIALLLAPSDR
jgi:hypothetical protein